MRFYGLDFPDGFSDIASKENDESPELDLDGTAWGERWVPFAVELTSIDYFTGARLAESDFFEMHIGLGLSRRAVRALRSVLADDGELLPLACPDGEFAIFNPLRRLSHDDIDLDHTGWCPPFSENRRIDTASFRQAAMYGRRVVALSITTQSPVYVDESFVRLSRDAGLRGVDFFLAWTDEPEVEVPPSPCAQLFADDPFETFRKESMSRS